VMLFFQQTPPKQIKQAPKRITIDVVFEDRKNAWGIGFSAIKSGAGAIVLKLEDQVVRNSLEAYRTSNNAGASGVELNDRLISINLENVEMLPHMQIIRKIKRAKLPCTLQFEGYRNEAPSPKPETNPFAASPTQVDEYTVETEDREKGEVLEGEQETKQKDHMATRIEALFDNRNMPWGIGLIIPANTLAAQTGAVVAVLEDSLVRTSFDSYRAPNTAEAVGVKIGDMLIEVNGENVENMPHLDIVHKLKTATLPCTLAFHEMRGKQEDQKEEKVTGKSMGDSEDVEMVISTTQNTTSLEQSACSTSSSNPFAPTGVSCTRNTNPFGDDGGSTAATFATMSVTIHPDNATTPTTVDSISPQCSPTNIPDQPLHMSVQRIDSVAVSIAQKKAEANIISKEELALLAAADERKRKVEEEEIQQMICTGQLMKNLDKPGEYINVLTGATVRPFQP